VKPTPQGNRPNDDLLVSWKDIAAYLKCSVRKAQRLERQELPVNRIARTKSVWTSKSEIDRWLTLQAEKTKSLQTASRENRVARIDGLEFGGPLRALPLPIRLWLLGISLTLTIAAAIVSAYGLTIILFGITAAFVMVMCPSLPDTSYVRGGIVLFMVAGASYSTSATSLPDVVRSVVNMTALRPALAYPVVTGLRFIPIPIGIAVVLVVFGFRNIRFAENRRLRAIYLRLGLLFLFIAATAGLITSGAHRIWQAGLSIRWTLLAGECFVLAVNIVLFVVGYRFFNAAEGKNYRQFLTWNGVGYMLIALTANIVNRHWNEINKYHLDVRRPYVYRVQNANAGDIFHNWLKEHASEAGPDLVRLFNDPEFVRALQSHKFYKEQFDELFQVSNKAVVFGYKNGPVSQQNQSPFVRIRFPASLAAALRLERS